jgi:hypothetical protein
MLNLFGQARGVEYVPQLSGREASGEFDRGGERRVRIAQKGEANFGSYGPLGVMADGFDKSWSGAGMLQGTSDGGFGQARIFQRSLPDA